MSIPPSKRLSDIDRIGFLSTDVIGHELDHGHWEGQESLKLTLSPPKVLPSLPWAGQALPGGMSAFGGRTACAQS